MKPLTASSLSTLRMRARPRPASSVALRPPRGGSSSGGVGRRLSSSSSLLLPPTGSFRFRCNSNATIARCHALLLQDSSIRWHSTHEGGGANNATTAPSSSRPFESHASSATVRHQRQSPSQPSFSGSKRTPIPGRLVRKPRNVTPPADINVHVGDVSVQPDADAVADPASLAAATNSDDGQAVSLSPSESRIAQRKAAIERRRLFLEKGINSPSSNSMAGNATISDGVSINSEIMATETADATVEATDKQNKTMATTGDDDSVNDNMKDAEQKNPQLLRRRPAVPLHSLGNSKLSAADLHRRHLKEQREKQKEQKQLHQQQQLEEEGITVDVSRSSTDSNQEGLGILSNRSRKASPNPGKPNRGGGGGGSVVASQSATARYRESRQRKRRNTESGLSEDDGMQLGTSDDGEGGNLKMNPSVMTIPLSSTSSDGSNSSPASDQYQHENISSSDKSNFEERYQKLRRQRQQEQGEDDEDEKEKNEGGGWFGWLWGKNR